MADRFGRKPLLMVTILVYSVGTLASGMSIGFWTLLAARAVTGIGVGGEWAVAHALVGETVPPSVRGRYGSYLQSGSAFARFFASMVGNLLAPSIGWRLAFMLSALPALLVVVIRREMPESDVWLLQRQGRRQQAARLRRRARPDARPGAAQDDGAGAVGDDVQHGGVLVQDDLAADLPAADAQPVARARSRGCC